MKNWWDRARKELRFQVTPSTYQTCLLGTTAHAFRDGVLTLRARGPLPCEVLRHRLAPLIRSALADASGTRVKDVRFIAPQEGIGAALAGGPGDACTPVLATDQNHADVD